MAFPVSLILIAIGAILAFAVSRSPNGINIHAVGWILMGVGLVGFLLSLLYWDRWGGGYWRRRRYVAADPYAAPVAPAAPRRTVVEEVDGPPAGPVAPGPPLDPPPPPP